MADEQEESSKKNCMYSLHGSCLAFLFISYYCIAAYHTGLRKIYGLKDIDTMNEYETLPNGSLWQQFAAQEQLSDEQLQKFQRYADLLLEWNEKSNLTAITSLQRVITDHFQASLALGHAIDLSTISSLAAVGTGGGFPGIPLAILYPHISVMLIEVNHKKVRFLQEVTKQLQLANVAISDYDWRTFLRQTEYDIELFCARASLQPEELLHMFKPSCRYRNAQLVYWASQQWQPGKQVVPFIVGDVSYAVDKKQRRLIVMRSAHEERDSLKF